MSNSEDLLVFKALCKDDLEQNAGPIHMPNPEHLLLFKAMRGPETDHLISWPMRGIIINITERGQTYTNTYGHRDSMTDLAMRAKSDY